MTIDMTMVSVVDDSDDEFPDLAEIINRRFIPGKASSSRPHQAKTADDSPQKDDRTVRGGIGRSRTNPKAIEEPEIAKPKPKKRILNQTFDNPLLRPIAASASSKDVSYVQGKSAPNFEARRQKIVRKTILDVEFNNISKSRITKEYEDEESEAEKQAKPVKKAAIRRDRGEEEAQSEEEKRPARRTVRSDTKAPTTKVVNLDSDTEEYERASGLSDFIIEDSIIPDEESVVEPPPPRPVRRLVQGRRRQIDVEDSDSEDLGRRLGKLRVDDVSEDSKKASKDLEDLVKRFGDDEPSARVPKRSSGGIQSKPPKAVKTTSKADLLTSDLDDPFILSYSPSEFKPRKVSKESRLVTPPGSPESKPKRLQSPKKQFPRIPSTPHRPSMDGFWQQDVVNDWNDEYSPQKTLFPNPGSGETEGSPKKSPVKQDRISKEAKKAFSQAKHALAESFLAELDAKITNGEIAKQSASTGGVKIIWSKKLNTTAGRANWKRETIKSSASAPDGKTIYRHHAAIELAEKVIDDEDRLLNVIAHEFCHLANFMVSNIKTNPHGKEFKAWAAKCSRHFGDRGIEVTTKHSYAIDYKYVWECTSCGIEFKRHSKSIDPARHQCGSCKSKLVQTKPVPRANAGTAKVSEYQLFVKENMKRLREENPGSPQKDVMGLVGKEYQVYKASKLAGRGKTSELNSINEVVRSKEGTPDDDVGAVARKLDFLDLTSP